MDKDEHCKEVYAYYGLAMYWAQCMEQSIINLLIFFDFFKEKAPNFTTSKLWQKDFDEFHEAVSSKTLGRLLSHLKNLNVIDAKTDSILQLALEKRNHLAHAFFEAHALDFVNEAGRNKMITILGENAQVFIQADKLIESLSLPMAAKYGLTKEVFEEYEAKLYQSIGD